MIKNFKNKRLKRLFYKADGKSLPPERVAKISLMLSRLESSQKIDNMNFNNYRLHQLTGNYNGF